MSSSTKDYHYPLRLPAEDAQAVDEVCRHSRASFNRVVSMCVRQALPAVREALSGEAGRVTNVDPLPKRVLNRLYRQPDDDSDSIQLFMDAQANTIKE